MLNQIEQLRKEDQSWQRSNTAYHQAPHNYIIIATPYLDLTNDDSINLFAKVIHHKVYLSDFGITLFNLEATGTKIKKSHKQIWKDFKQILDKFHIDYDKSTDTLSITADINQYPQIKLRLIQAILHIQTLANLRKD